MPADAYENQDALHGTSGDYVRVIELAGGAPLLLPPTRNAETAQRVIESADGLLLSGGGDIDPRLLNEDPHPALKTIDPLRDATEVAAIETAMARSIPILGICKGAQILNVALGGGLIQHIDESADSAIGHSQRTATASGTHRIEIAPDSLLARLLGPGARWVNTFHHQAVGRVADSLTISANSADGIIEAIEASDDKPILALQFHPEKVIDEEPIFLKLFQWLVDAALTRKR